MYDYKATKTYQQDPSFHEQRLQRAKENLAKEIENGKKELLIRFWLSNVKFETVQNLRELRKVMTANGRETKESKERGVSRVRNNCTVTRRKFDCKKTRYLHVNGENYRQDFFKRQDSNDWAGLHERLEEMEKFSVEGEYAKILKIKDLENELQKKRIFNN